MPIAAGISAVGSIGGAGLGAWASMQGANMMQQSAMQALMYQKQIYGQAKKNLSPYMTMGKNAASSLSDLYGLGPHGKDGMSAAFNNFTKLPAFQFPMQQGLRALNFNLSAQGKTQSGAEARETQQFGQGLASQYMMSNYVQPLMQMSGEGRMAATSLGQIGAQSAAGVGQTMMAGAQAGASGLMGAANAISGGIGGLTNAASLYSFMNSKSGSTPSNLSSYANPGMPTGNGMGLNLNGLGGVY